MKNLTRRHISFTLTVILGTTPPVLAQTQTKELKTEKALHQSSEPIFMVVEKQPEFPGGNLERMRFFTRNLRIPKTTKPRRVIVSFVVNTDGTLQDISILKGQTSEYDLEVLRVAKSMPNWIPGSQSGKSIRVKYILPVEI